MDQRSGRANERTIKDATVKRYHYDSHEQFRVHLADFVIADNFARRLKTLRGLTPYEAICKAGPQNRTASGRTRFTKRQDQTSSTPHSVCGPPAARIEH